MLLRVAAGLGLLAWLAGSGAIDASRLVGLARAWPLSVAALLLVFLTLLLTSWRLCILLGGQGLHLPLMASLRLSLIGALFSNVLPGSTGGDLVRVYLAARPNAGRRTEIATTLVIDRIVGLLALLLAPVLIAVAGSRLMPGAEPLRQLVLIAMVGWIGLIAFLIIGAHPDGVVRRVVVRVLGRTRVRFHIERIFESIRAHRTSGRTVLGAFAISILIQSLNIVIIQLILIANGAPSISWVAALLTPFGMLANSIPLTPGGLGVGEAAFESLFLIAGLTGGAEAILSWRVITTLVDLCGGGLLIAGRTDIAVLRDPGIEPAAGIGKDRREPVL
jgi:glycosyltransferase 2 family protein